MSFIGKIVSDPRIRAIRSGLSPQEPQQQESRIGPFGITRSMFDSAAQKSSGAMAKKPLGLDSMRKRGSFFGKIKKEFLG